MDKLINDMQHEAVAKKQKKIEEQINLDEYEDGINDIEWTIVILLWNYEKSIYHYILLL